jgi:hypothetical protein
MRSGESIRLGALSLRPHVLLQSSGKLILCHASYLCQASGVAWDLYCRFYSELQSFEADMRSGGQGGGMNAHLKKRKK